MLAFARVALLRLLRDRTNAFFLVLFPMLLVLLIGLQFADTGGLLGVVAPAGDERAEAVLDALRAEEVDLLAFDDEEAARTAVGDGEVDAALVLPPLGADAELPAAAAWYQRPDGSAAALRATASAAVGALDARLVAAEVVADATGTGLEEARATVAGLDGTAVVPAAVSVETIGTDELAAEFEGLGRFDLGASSQLLLFVFVTALTGSGAVVQSRRFGVLDRVLAGPTSPVQAIAGLALGQLAVALTQAVVILVGSSLLFGVRWGDPLATGLVVLLFSVVATGAGLLLGAVLRTEEQAGGVGVPLGLGLAALGGSMLPLELFPDGMRSLSRVTPHAWGNEAFAEIVRRGGGVLDVLPQLGVLLAFALVVCVAASWALGRRLGAAA